ncbi:sialate O-acetylesterase [Pedobacter heparinus]|uniref:sialate O-acetylesterase n=1 Tax=Pedobacter heparinus TaxID=984 RepID=UPI00292FA782|nr:sialate O-acetylesterase [Pedobacter heparinus]
MFKRVVLIFLLVFVQQFTFAQSVKLAAVFTDHMVLQRDKPVTIYGRANANAAVEATFNQITLHTTANPEGKWALVFPKMPHGGPYQLQVQSRQSDIILKDILIGDVWLCSGQSNMEFPLNQSATGMAELAQLKENPLLRIMKFKNAAETNNQGWDSLTLARVNNFDYFEGEWLPVNSHTAKTFSAVAYYFGKNITAETQVPVGLIQMAVGGSPIESWIDGAVLLQDPQVSGILTGWRTSAMLQDWVRDRTDVNLKHARSPDQHHPFEPGYNYQAGIAALTAFPIKGVIWYQGESNAQDAAQYEKTFPVLVNSWRKQWADDFPFYYVQLSSLDRPLWPEFRDAQRRLQLNIPNTGMAVSLDLGDSLDVHPKRKKEVGERLALLALKDTYHQAVKANGPMVSTATLKHNEIVISFKENDKLFTRDQMSLKGFELLTAKGKRLKPVNATIVNNQVLLSIPKGQQIKKVWYAWQPFTRANLVNKAGLPASTFSISLP